MNYRKETSRDHRLSYQPLEQRQLLSANALSEEAQVLLTREFLASTPETQYLQEGRSDIELMEIKYGLASTTTRYQQTIDGLPVHNAIITLNQGPNGNFQLSHHQLAYDPTVVEFPLMETNFQVDSKEAEGLAMEHAGITETHFESRIELGWYVDEAGEVSQVWDMTVYNYYDKVGDYLTVVDVDWGAVLLQENRAAFATGTGDVFEPNPYQTLGSGTGLADNDDATSAALDAQMVTVTLERLDEGTGLLTGEWVDLATLNSDEIADEDADEPTRVYQYDRDDNRFEQVVIYHAIDQINEYFHFLGFDDDTGVPNGIRDFPSLANAHWFDADQSFYSAGDDAVHFGDGGVDDGEDADIIAHEYGHAIHFNQNAAWGGGEMGAMGEGWGDYLAAAFYKDFGNPLFQSAHAAAVGEWDATSYSFDDPPNLRRVDGNKMYPTDLVGFVHDDGEIWSRALWDLNHNVGADYANQLILEHHFTLIANASMVNAADAILQANANFNVSDPTNNLARVRHGFVERGILPHQLIIEFDANEYAVGDQIEFYLSDVNATGPALVQVTTSDGDSETVLMTDTGTGLLKGSIQSTSGLAMPGDGVLNVLNAVNDIQVRYFDASSNIAIDNAIITSDVVTGTPDDDIIVVDIGDTLVTITVNGTPFTVPQTAGSYSFDALSGYDTITIFDSSNPDTTTIRDKSVTVDGDFDFQASSAESIKVISRGGFDMSSVYGTNADEVFQTFGTGSVLNGDGFTFETRGMELTYLFGNGGLDTAFLGDTAGNDRLYATDVFANFDTANGDYNLRDFAKISVHATNGGFDTASVVGSALNEQFFADPNMINLKSETDSITAIGFDRTWVDGGAGTDTALFVGTPGNDTFNSTPTNAYLFGTAFFNQGLRFENVTVNSNGGDDRANVQDSPGDDNFYAATTHSVLYSANSRVQVNGYKTVSAIGSSGFDRATFVDTFGNDRYVGRPNDAFMIGSTGFLNYALNFNATTARSTGGMDTAVFHSSFGDDHFFGSHAKSYLTGSTFFNQALNFGNVSALFSSGGFDVGIFEDSPSSDTFVGLGERGVLYDGNYIVFTTGLDLVIAKSNKGGVDVLAENGIDYEVRLQGDWV